MHKFDGMSDDELIAHLEILQLEASSMSEWCELANLPQIKTLVAYLREKLEKVKAVYSSINPLSPSAPVLLASNQGVESEIKSQIAKIEENKKLKISVDLDIKYGVELLAKKREDRKKLTRSIVSAQATKEKQEA